MYVGSYLTERLGQSIGNDLRVRLYHHLQELSLAYYDTNRVGAILNTLTGDVQTIQSFASTTAIKTVKIPAAAAIWTLPVPPRKASNQEIHSGAGRLPTTLPRMLLSGQGAANAGAICTSVAATEPAIGPQQLKQKWRKPMFKGCH
jgi:ABC-type multidrug transport system fused ATPase/permease subunit